MDDLVKRLTEKMPIDDQDEVTRIQRGVRLHLKIQENNGVPVAKYDQKRKEPYLEYPDGRKDYHFSKPPAP